MTFPETVQVAHTSSGPGNRRPSLCLRARMGTRQLLQPGGGRQSGASMPRSMIRTPIRPGFCRPPRSRSRDRRRGGLRGRGWWRRRWCVCVRRPHRARAPQGSRAPCSPGSVRPEPSRRRPARSRPEPPAPGPATAGRGLFPRPASSGLQPRSNIPGSPRPVAPVPAPPPPRVFRPSKDRATQISLGCPLPSGPFSGRVSGAAKSLVFSPKWKVWGAGAAGAASNCSARSNSCQ